MVNKEQGALYALQEVFVSMMARLLAWAVCFVIDVSKCLKVFKLHGLRLILE